MGLARHKVMETQAPAVSEDARRRLDSARVRDLSFQIKTIAPILSDDDAECAAATLLEMRSHKREEVGQQLREKLMMHGRSRDAAERIATAIGF